MQARYININDDVVLSEEDDIEYNDDFDYTLYESMIGDHQHQADRQILEHEESQRERWGYCITNASNNSQYQ